MSLISVIMPYYKKEKSVKNSILSILEQTYQNFEIILVDDQNDDKSKDCLREISKIDSRIKLIENDRNLGAGMSRNKALSHAQGEYIAFCDCDDIWKKNKLKMQIDFMKKKNIDFSFTSYEMINEKGTKIGFRPASDVINFEKLKFSCDIGLSTVVIKKKLLEDNKFMFAPLKTKEDYVLWLLITQKGIDLFGIKENLTLWMKTPNSLSSSVIQKLIDGYRVYRIYLKYNPLKSFFYLMMLSINFLIKK